MLPSQSWIEELGTRDFRLEKYGDRKCNPSFPAFSSRPLEFWASLCFDYNCPWNNCIDWDSKICSIQAILQEACMISSLCLVIILLIFNQAPSLPAPPFNLLLGNMGAMAEIYAHAPTNTHPMGIMTMLRRRWNLKGMWFLDTWPFGGSERQIVIVDPVSRSFKW